MVFNCSGSVLFCWMCSLLKISLNLFLENVNLNSNSGPNSFGQKLFKYMPSCGVTIENTPEPDAYLCFIESGRPTHNAPLFQRLDGIYFNSAFDYTSQNSNIKRTYELAKGVIFQSQFNIFGHGFSTTSAGSRAIMRTMIDCAL